MCVYKPIAHHICGSTNLLESDIIQYSLPILDTLQKMINSLLVNVDVPINTKDYRLKD